MSVHEKTDVSPVRPQGALSILIRHARRRSLHRHTKMRIVGVALFLGMALIHPAVNSATSASSAAIGSTPLATVHTLARTIGPRPGGSAAESRAAEWLGLQLRAAGYAMEIQDVPVPLPGKGLSHNVIARIGPAPWHLVGAHYDTKRGPGADDNASGCAVVLEVARRMRGSGLSLMIVFFGAEEMQSRRLDDHHYGSRRLADSLAFSDIASVTNIDMVGLGPQLHVRDMMRRGQDAAPNAHARAFLATAQSVNPAATRLVDRIGLSDHEAFARRGWPHAWLERRPNDRIHSAADTEVNLRLLDETVTILELFLRRFITR